MTVTDDQLLATLVEADPARGLAPDAALLGSLLRGSIAAAPRARRRWPWVAGGIAAVFALGVASPAIAHTIRHLAQTGWFASPNPPGTDLAPEPTFTNTESDNSEWLDVAAPDFVDYSVSIYPAYITLPSQYDPAAFARVLAEADQKSYPGPGYVQATGVIQHYEYVARCAWDAEWLADYDAGNQPGMDAAAQVLTTAAHWPATVSTDGGNVVSYFSEIASAATAGDHDAVAQEQVTGCAPIPVGALR
jgi:hypothetical protein